MEKIREQDQITKGAKPKQPVSQATSTAPTETNVQTRAPFPSGPVAQRNLPVPTGPKFQATPNIRTTNAPRYSDSSDSRQAGSKKTKKPPVGKKKTRLADVGPDEETVRKWKVIEGQIEESRRRVS